MHKRPLFTSEAREHARVNATNEADHLEAIDSLDLSAFTARERAILKRAEAFLPSTRFRYLVRAVRGDVARTS